MRVLVQIQGTPLDADARALTELTRSAVRETLRIGGAPRACEASVLFVDDAEIQALNARYRGIDRPTDVLAFSLREAEEQPPEDGAGLEMLGDIVISLPTAARQAAKRGHSLRHETAILLIHGTLHLLGHDHPGTSGAAADRARTQAMRSLERRALQTLLSKMVV